jgi:hypothetical protein
LARLLPPHTCSHSTPIPAHDQQAGLWGDEHGGDGVNVALVADHGMAAISPERVVTLSEMVNTSSFQVSGSLHCALTRALLAVL